MRWRNWRDQVSLLLLLGLPLMWLVNAALRLNLAGEVTGASIAGWTLVVQFYFRRAETGNGG